MEDNVTAINDKSMRKSQKEQIENILVVLDQAHAAIKKALETKNTEIALTLLEQAQDSAIQVGGMIEESLGEDFVTVGMLESYCEQIFQTYEMIRRQQPLNIIKIYKYLQKGLIRIENSIKYDIQVRTEVVFLPYKASMWDSLESVWKAADADESTDAYVIPIPYFDKNPDGSFREEHYEGNLYPKNVPITRYDEYDLEARRPDVIYIHNPYDEHNHVTSVHPFFYSKNLKKYTDKLVYIPYFVLNEIEPDNQAAIDGMKHFCFTPGTIYADQVIVQSENMRQIYINEYIKTAKEMGLGGEHVDRKFLEKKFLGTGSPKFDKVLNTRKEDLDIPAEWLKIIEKPDGRWKKIVFYNISVIALLHAGDKLLRKMESVFKVFKENKDEVVLLWRPHPLIQSTIGSMRPQLWEAYKEIRDKYIEEGWGIYDDSADIDRAIILSDAYYGVGSSSVVQLYKMLCRPILLQCVDFIKENNNQIFLTSYICCLVQDDVVLISETTNAVMLISKKDWTIKSIFEFKEEMYSKELYLAASCNANKMIAVPFYADNFRMINFLTGDQKVINGCIYDDEKKRREKFITSIVCGNHVWIIGEKIKRIIGMEVNSLAVFSDIAFADIKGLEDIADKIVWGTGYVVVKNNILLASRNYGIILSINNLTNEAVVCAHTENVGFSYLYEYNKEILLIDQSGYEYLYDVEQSIIEKIGRKFDDACWKCIVAGENRYYFEAFLGKIIKISKNDTEEIIFNSAQDILQAGVKFQFVQQDGKYIYFQERFSGYIFILDTDTDIYVRQEIDVSTYIREWQKKTLEQNMTENFYVYTENQFLSVENLLEYLGV